MKLIVYLVVIAALAWGGMWVYENYLAESVNNTVTRTANFATDADVKNTNYTGSGASY